ncbi:HAMP domain-containing histidine kinase [Paenibacillus sp. J5C_2022]|uniref:sensor histidine kinase n=1 Tax=Paenibacillus sp. J5C2022 TaxID=2977129 RepID=UPI0021CE40AD|nr:HAMP domain-containing sensor histidine kinase [Paenibacillus sp. J5C2022]MCU6707193.1 HAMP domain-containing histidine kinase [Paenibacillus sp. J5C2022]
MSIRLRLYLSYLAMAFVPVILMSSFFILLYHLSGKEDLRKLSEERREEYFNQALIYGELKYVIDDDTGRLEDKAFLHELQTRLREQWAGLLVGQDGVLTNVSPFLMELSPEEDWAEFYREPPEKTSFHLYRFSTHQIEFQYPDGSAGRIVLLNRMETIPIFWDPLVMIIMLLFVGLTSLILTYLVSRSIIKPLQSLRTAAIRMKDGDLSEKVALGRKKPSKKSCRDEIVQLGTAFEEMRDRLKQSIDQSLQYEENRKQLLSHISHDLKTPIAAIKGYVEGIRDGIANTDEKRERYMLTIYRKASEMDRLIDELFLFSKLDLQKVAYDFKVVDIGLYLEDFMEEQRFHLEKSGVKLQFHRRESGELPIAADPDKLNRVLANILDNSVKYMAQQDEKGASAIEVDIWRAGQYAMIAIQDTGPGIEPDDLPYIFDRFYRAEQSRNSETGGSGLGLAIVKQIVDGHNGEVWAENGDEGGARFCLKLPLVQSLRGGEWE